MNIKSDYHIHTWRCKHAVGEMEAYVEKAIQLGLEEIAFTDHIPLPHDFDIEHRMSLHELDDYMQTVTDLDRAYPEISIRKGIEADYYEGFESYTEDLLSRYPFDVILMAVHFIRHWPEENWVFNYDFGNKPPEAVYTDYLQTVLTGIKTGLFNVVAHLDLIKMADLPLVKHNEDDLKMVFNAVKEHDMAIEINTSGKRKTIGELYPAPSVIKMMFQNDVPFTVGSDAHSPVQVGMYFDTVEADLAYPPVRFYKRQMHSSPVFESESGEVRNERNLV